MYSYFGDTTLDTYPGAEQAFVRILSVPLPGGVRGGFMVSMRAKNLGRSLLNSAQIDDVYRRAKLPRLCLHYGMASSSQLPGPTDAARQFATTHWSVVLTAGAGSSLVAQAALETLCRVNSAWPKARLNRMSTGSNNAIGKYCEPKSHTLWRGRRMWTKNFAICSRCLAAEVPALLMRPQDRLQTAEPIPSSLPWREGRGQGEVRVKRSAHWPFAPAIFPSPRPSPHPMGRGRHLCPRSRGPLHLCIASHGLHSRSSNSPSTLSGIQRFNALAVHFSCNRLGVLL